MGMTENSEGKQSLAVSTKPLKLSLDSRKSQQTNSFSAQNNNNGKTPFKVRQKKTYPFLDLDVSGMPEELQKSKLICLLEIKLP